MADVMKDGKGAAVVGKSSAAKLTKSGKKKLTGKTKRTAKKRVGGPVDWMPLEQATPAKSAQAMMANGRTATANGRKPRAAPADNVAALKPVHALYTKLHVQFDARGMPKVVMQGAELVGDQLAVAIEVDALSPRSLAGTEWLDEMAFVSKRREAILRLHPGRGAENTALRAKFGLHEAVRPGQPQSLADGAQALLVGKKSAPGSRAAKLITADDEKRLKAILQAVPKVTAEQRKVRNEGVSRTTQLEILNNAVELFYDDFAATVGIVLEDDEVARVEALQLIPRRPEQRTEKKDEGGETGEPGAGGSTQGAGSTSTALVKA